MSENLILTYLELIIITIGTCTGIILVYYEYINNPNCGLNRLIGSIRARIKQLAIILILICLSIFIVQVVIDGNKTIIGKPINSDIVSLSIYPEFYDPSGLMGDVGDITIQKNDSIIRFFYSGMGNEPHESENKYLDNGTLNSRAARFGGVMFLNPANNYGDQIGWDLRNFHKSLDWEARTVDGKCNVKFLVGGIRWKWIDGKIFRDVPYPDSMNARNFGIKTLNTSWQKFSANLSNIPINEFSNVIGGFGWTISPDDQGFTDDADTGSQNSGICTIEVKNIQYR